MEEKDVVDAWIDRVVRHAESLDDQHDKGGHDWFSLWVGFVIGLGHEDLASYEHYSRLGLPVEIEDTPES
jgi:hypothetical protein